MKLYEVNIRLMVVAEDKDAAMWEAGRADVSACDVEIAEAKIIPAEWADAFPFGGDGVKKCREYVNKFSS